jgi:RNA polymerase sigma-70 factor (ECF subfamily)
MCRHDQDAQDVVQDTLLAAARSLRDFRAAASVSTWLYAITRSFCIKKRRRSKFAPRFEVSLDASEGRDALVARDPARGPEELAQGNEVQAALEQAIRTLEPRQREVLLLRDVEGLSAPETAEVTGLSVEAVKSRLHRARVALRERLAPLLGLPEPPGAGASCPDVLAALARHLDGELSRSACADMERHLAGCPGCQGLCDSLKGTLALCRELPTPEVPPQVQAVIRSSLRDLLAARG